MKQFYKNLEASHNFQKNLNPWYVTGFCEGESAFTFSRTGLKALNLYFAVKLVQNEGKLIYELYEFFRVGKIYRVKPAKPNRQTHTGWTKSALYYRVSKISEIERIIGHFDNYPLCGLKAGTYKIWKEMFFIKKNKPLDYKKLDELAKKLSLSSPRNQPWK